MATKNAKSITRATSTSVAKGKEILDAKPITRKLAERLLNLGLIDQEIFDDGLTTGMIKQGRTVDPFGKHKAVVQRVFDAARNAEANPEIAALGWTFKVSVSMSVKDKDGATKVKRVNVSSKTLGLSSDEGEE